MTRRGMVQVDGVTYRVCGVLDRYEIVRILDDRRVGAFDVEPRLRLLEHGLAPELVLAVAREALRRCIARRAPQRPSAGAAALGFCELGNLAAATSSS